jgi:hypothetical protein
VETAIRTHARPLLGEVRAAVEDIFAHIKQARWHLTAAPGAARYWRLVRRTTGAAEIVLERLRRST